MTAPVVGEHADAVAALHADLAGLRRRLSPPPRLTVSEWADRYREIARGTSSEPGKWRTSRAPYLREIMDAVSDPRIERIVMQKPRRVGGTEVLNNVIGYFIHQDPSPIILVQPTVEMAEEWSKKQLSPMLTATPALRDKVREARVRDSGNTVLSKEYPGGHISIIGANSGAGFRMRTARVVCGDEIDAWPLSAGAEGDPVELLIGRTDTYHNRKVILCSTPLLKGMSRIESAYAETDQRRFQLPCLDCAAFQVPQWRHLKYDGLEPAYLCEHCGVLSPEAAKYEMVRNGKWVAERPDVVDAAGFQWAQLISLFDGARWPVVIDAWQKAQKDPTRLQVFWNQRMGETHDDRGAGLSMSALSARKGVGYGKAEVPLGVGLLTCSADVQADRLYAVVRGWGAGEETWRIAAKIFIGDTSGPAVWEDFDQWRAREWTHESGTTMRVHTTCIDSGFNAEMVYRYCVPRYGQRVYATKGSSMPGRQLVNRRPSVNNKLRCRVFYVGTDTAKDLLFGRLRVTEPGPLHWHFDPAADEDYFEQLTSERRVRKQSNGRWVSRYDVLPNRENHYLDCEVGNIVAFQLSNVQLGQMATLVERVNAEGAKAKEPQTEPEKPQPSPVRGAPQPRPRGGFVRRY